MNDTLKKEKPRRKSKVAAIVGRVIARQRLLSNMTQAELAHQLGIEPETLSRMETGTRSTSVERLLLLAEIFKCPIGIFVEEESENIEAITKNLAFQLQPLHEDDRLLITKFMVEMSKRFRKTRNEQKILVK